MSIETVARRYATALADVVLKTGETDSVKSELKIWEQLIAGNPELESAFGNPSIAAAKKEAVLEGLLGKTKPSKTTSNFLRVLLRNGRLTDLSAVNEKFESVLEERSLGGVLIRILMDDVQTTHAPDSPWHVVRMTKYVASAAR